MNNKPTFNYCVPREYKDKNTGEIRYALCHGGDQMNIATLDEIQKYADENRPKNGQPWIQVFNNGHRVCKENLDWSEWNGFTYIDLDTKLYYNNVKPFNIQNVLNSFIDILPTLYPYNFYCVHLSNSKLGYRIFWYWDCKRTEENFKKCCLISEYYIKDLFYRSGDQGKAIIDYTLGRSKVLDSCSNSVMQGSYVTINDIYYSDYINNDDFGQCDLDEIVLEDAYKNVEVIKYTGGVTYSSNVDYVGSKPINEDLIPYYPHSHRWCIYDALITLFVDKDKVDEEWERIANLIPEQNGHTHNFYIEEPEKNHWYEIYDDTLYHDLSWLNSFGYEYSDDTEYVYYKQFRKSWKKHIHKAICSMYVSKELQNLSKNIKGKDLDNYKDECMNAALEHNAFDSFWDDYFTEYADKIELEKYRKSYYKKRWQANEFRYLCNGYNIPKDIITYKMYADFYYRDENNLPTIKYDLLEDEVKVFGYWPETNKWQIHPFKYGNEYTHWKNNDTFSNSCNKTDLMEAVDKYSSRWHTYHEIKEYLNGLDLELADEELLETWAIRYFDAEDTKYVREISKKFFIAAVKKQLVEDPTSFVFQHMLFLQGATGCGKTHFLVQMFTINGHSYILNKVDPNGKDNEIGPLIAKNWLIQFGESENLKKVSVNAAKEFVDRINLGFKYQKKFQNEQTTTYPRIVACRTSNDDVLFNDVSISSGDRRNWLIVCRTGINSCDENLRATIKREKDILWATALKLYLDNPDMDLELSNDAFSELAERQEDFKLIKSDEVKEVYDEVFNRIYLTNNKGYIEDCYSFFEMLKRNDTALETPINVTDLLDDYSFTQKMHINRIPARWLKDWIKQKYGVNMITLLKKYMIEHGWKYKQAGYLNGTLKCWCKED